MTPKEKLLLVSSKASIKYEELDANDINVIINGSKYDFAANEDGTPTSRAVKDKYANDLKRSHYKNLLSNHFENLVILSGAGTSVGWGGKTMRELWDAVQAELTNSVLENFCKAIGFIDESESLSTLKEVQKDLEKLLSRAHGAKDFVKVYKESPIDISTLVSKAEKVIQTKCKLQLIDSSPHEQFLNKITNRRLKDPRVKLFTLNYDTLFEQAAVKGNLTVIDGFSFANPRTLSGRNFDYDVVYRGNNRIKDEESFIPKVFHLYKLHGSVDWEMRVDNVVVNEATNSPLMVFPRDNKYENSYDQPYFEMMSRFQQNLRNDNVLLICIGFSFSDKHILSAIKEAVSQNPSFRLLIIIRTIRSNDGLNWFIEKTKTHHNIMIVAEEFKDFVHTYPYSLIYSEPSSLENEAKTI